MEETEMFPVQAVNLLIKITIPSGGTECIGYSFLWNRFLHMGQINFAYE